MKNNEHITCLGRVATYINGYAFKPDDWSNEGIPIIRIQDLTGNSSQTNKFNGNYDKKYEINDGDVLISWSASIGVHVWKRGTAVLNQHIFKVVFDKTSIDKEFFVHQVENILSNTSGQVHGSTMKHLTKPVFDALPFYLPPLDEQHRIARELHSVTELISKHKTQLNKLDELVKSQFTEMFDGQWPTGRLEEFANVGSSKRVFVGELKNTGIPFFRGTEIGALAEGKQIVPELFITEEHYCTLKEATGVPQIGDLLFPSICPDGRIWIVDTEKPFYFKDGRVLWVHTNSKSINPVYLQYALKNIMSRDYKTLASGSTFAELKIFILKQLEIPIPPQNIQDNFQRFILQIDKSKFAIRQSLTQLETLKNSLMQKYFG